MSKIEARSKSIQETLHNTKYGIDFYQREYKWRSKNIVELLEDLENKFLGNYSSNHEPVEVENYENYFLGSIVISNKQGEKLIIDGQQRLTSITLLLIYLHNLQKDSKNRKVIVSELIFSEKFGARSFNLNVDERVDGMEALYNEKIYDFDSHDSESVQNMGARFEDIKLFFPDSLKGEVLPFFIDWLLHKVSLVHIEANNEDDAYTIFETMNDRGLSLSPTDMLKGYLLANITDGNQKSKANDLWKKRVLKLVEHGKEEEGDFFKHWFRAKYAETIRERKKGTENKDFEKVATSFHKWVRDNKKILQLKSSTDFYEFISKEFDFYSRQYLQILNAAEQYTKGLEYIYFNEHNNFTHQYHLLLSPLKSTDTQDIINRKLNIVAYFIDFFIVNRFISYKSLTYSAIDYTMYNLTKEIRNKEISDLIEILKVKAKETDRIEELVDFRLHQQNKKYVHYLLARITHHIEKESGFDSSFKKYVTKESRNPYQIEHIWANKFERYKHEFNHETEFLDFRNRVGGLVLLPKGINQSYGDKDYNIKLQQYFSQNLLAKSLHQNCYQNNPGFSSYITKESLPFKPHSKFEKRDMNDRQELYAEIACKIWNPDNLSLL